MKRDSFARLTKIPVRCSNRSSILPPCSQYQPPPSPLNNKNRMIKKVNTNYRSAFNDNLNTKPNKYNVQFIERVIVFNTETCSKPEHLNDYQYLIDSSKRNRQKRLHQRKNPKSNSKQFKVNSKTLHQPNQIIVNQILKPMQQIEFQNDNQEDDDLTIFPLQISKIIGQKQVDASQQIKLSKQQRTFAQVGIQTIPINFCQCDQKSKLIKKHNNEQLQRCQEPEQIFKNEVRNNIQEDLNKINQQQKDNDNKIQIVKQIIMIHDSPKRQNEVVQILDKNKEVIQIDQINIVKQSIVIDNNTQSTAQQIDLTNYQDTQQQNQSEKQHKQNKRLQQQLKSLFKMNQNNPNFGYICCCETQNKQHKNMRATRSRKTIYAAYLSNKQQQITKQKSYSKRKSRKSHYSTKLPQNNYCFTCYGLKPNK